MVDINKKVEQLKEKYKSIVQQNADGVHNAFLNGMYGIKEIEQIKKGAEKEYMFPLGESNNINLYARFKGSDLFITAASNISIPIVREEHLAQLEIVLGNLENI